MGLLPLEKRSHRVPLPHSEKVLSMIQKEDPHQNTVMLGHTGTYIPDIWPPELEEINSVIYKLLHLCHFVMVA